MAEEGNIGLHVAKQLSQHLGGDLKVTSSADGDICMSFSVAAQGRIETTLLTGGTRQTQPQKSLTRADSYRSVAKLTHIMVLTTSVIDRCAMKYTLCNKMQLTSSVQFVATKTEAIGAFKTLHDTTEGATGYALVLVDISAKGATLQKMINEINQGLENEEIFYRPRFVYLSADLVSSSKTESFKAIGFDNVFVKPLTMGDLMKYLKRIKYDINV